MSPEKRAAVRAWVRETRLAQGLPEHVEDEATLAELAAMVADALAANGNGGPPGDRPPREPEGRHGLIPPPQREGPRRR